MSGEALILESVGVALGGRDVVRDVSLTLQPGRLTCIVGPNGAGKTSLLRALVGLLPYRGAARLGATDLARLKGQARARRIGYLPQGHEAHWPLPARDIVALGRIPHGAADPSRLSPQDQEAVAAAMRLTGTEDLAGRPVTTLSGGERARIALARVFALGAPVLLADEPTAALDPRHQIDVMRALRRSSDAGALVVAVTHEIGLAARFADAVLVLREGRVEAFGPPAEALSAEILARAFGIDAYRAEHQGAPVLVPWG